MKSNKNSFSARLIRSFLAVSIVSISVCFVLYAAYTVRTTVRALEQTLSEQTSFMSEQLNEVCNRMSFISLEILNRSEFLRSARQLYFNEENAKMSNQYWNGIVGSIYNYATFQDLYNITYLSRSGGYYNMNSSPKGDSRIAYLSADEMSQLPWAAVTAQPAPESVWTVLQNAALASGTQETFCMVQPLAIPTQIAGYLMIQIPTDALGYSKRLFQESDYTVGVFSSEGTPFCAEGNTLEWFAQELPNVTQANGLVRARSGAWYFAYSKACADHPLSTTVLFPGDVLLRSLTAKILPLLLAFGGTVLLMALAILKYAHKFSRPLLYLTRTIRDTTLENLHTVTTPELKDASDEIIFLNETFVEMAKRLTKTMGEKIEMQKQQGEQRYRYLQYQINPHFLYNTLGVMGSMGLLKKGQEVYEASQMLAKILRYSLQDSQQGTTFREEFDNIHTYLELMKLRYEHKILFCVFMDETLAQATLPRFTLQPLVENVFQHAFGIQWKVIRLSVTARRNGDLWEIVIQDDGRGMSVESLQQICAEIEAAQSAAHAQGAQLEKACGIGLKNTIVRLNTFFEGNCSYTIASKPGQGCTIVLSGQIREIAKNGQAL